MTADRDKRLEKLAFHVATAADRLVLLTARKNYEAYKVAAEKFEAALAALLTAAKDVTK